MKTIDLAPSPVLEIPPLILPTKVGGKKKTADMVFFPGMWSTANHSPCSHWSDLVANLEVINWPGHNGNDTQLLEGLDFMGCYHHAVNELAKFISPPHVMAHSFGALVLERVRYYQPQLMKSLVTINGAPPGQIGVPSKFRFVPYLYYLHGTKRPFELFRWDRTFVAGKSRGIEFGPESALVAKEVLQGQHHIPHRDGLCEMLHVFGDSDQFYSPRLQHTVAKQLGARPMIVEDADHMFHCNPRFKVPMQRIIEWSFSHN
jgi:pimeloyl-ACP methyl ester carboxylesterase